MAYSAILVRNPARLSSITHAGSLETALGKFQSLDKRYCALRSFKLGIANTSTIEAAVVDLSGMWLKQQHSTFSGVKQLSSEDADTALGVALEFGEQYLLQSLVISRRSLC